MNETDLVPDQHSGAESNTTETLQLASGQDARRFFEIVSNRLMDVNSWDELAGQATANFRLFDRDGHPVSRLVREGDYVRIDIPGPGPSSGEGYDWVRVESIESIKQKEKEALMILVHPSNSPVNEKPGVAHFFSDEASSSFLVSRTGKEITAAVYGRNEKPNTETSGIVDKTRNALVATAAIGGFAKMQWSLLVKGLLKDSP